jgi:predicted  nucleic acid-binding Zn-ribbon protein
MESMIKKSAETKEDVGWLDTRLNALESNLDAQFNKLNDAYNSLKLEIQTLSGRISPIEHDLRTKASQETFNALERRVAKIEDSPNSIRANAGLLISSIGCASGILFSALSITATIVIFLLLNWHH